MKKWLLNHNVWFFASVAVSIVGTLYSLYMRGSLVAAPDIYQLESFLLFGAYCLLDNDYEELREERRGGDNEKVAL
jgi:hypothetical protein